MVLGQHSPSTSSEIPPVHNRHLSRHSPTCQTDHWQTHYQHWMSFAEQQSNSVPSQAFEKKPAPLRLCTKPKLQLLRSAPGRVSRGTPPAAGIEMANNPPLQTLSLTSLVSMLCPLYCGRMPADFEKNMQTAYSVMLTLLISSLLRTEGCRVHCFPLPQPLLTPHPSESP